MTVAMDLRRYHEWMRRAWTIRPDGELWAEQPDHPAREPVERLGDRLGRGVDVNFIMVRTLLADVVHAAGGVEYHSARVLTALDRSQRNYDDGVADNPPRADPNHECFPIEESLAWDYANLVIWLRTVEERVDRLSLRFDPAPKLSRFEKGLVWLLRHRQPDLVWRRRPARTRVGLLPAVGEAQLRAEIEQLLGSFKDRVGDERTLANYGPHAAQLPDPGTPNAALRPDGTLVVPIPDPPAEPIYVFDQFTFDQRRDLATFAIAAVNATDEFMTAILDAFEKAATRVATPWAPLAADR
jgi:hypothetical protein